MIYELSHAMSKNNLFIANDFNFTTYPINYFIERHFTHSHIQRLF